MGADNDLYILNAQRDDAGHFHQRVTKYSSDTELKTNAVDFFVQNTLYDGGNLSALFSHLIIIVILSMLMFVTFQPNRPASTKASVTSFCAGCAGCYRQETVLHILYPETSGTGVFREGWNSTAT